MRIKSCVWLNLKLGTTNITCTNVTNIVVTCHLIHGGGWHFDQLFRYCTVLYNGYMHIFKTKFLQKKTGTRNQEDIEF